MHALPGFGRYIRRKTSLENERDARSEIQKGISEERVAPMVAVVRAAGPEESCNWVRGRCTAEPRAVAAQELREQYDGPGDEPAWEFRAHAYDNSVLESRGTEA